MSKPGMQGNRSAAVAEAGRLKAAGSLSVHGALRLFSIRTRMATRFQEGSKALVGEIVRNCASSFLAADYIF